MSRRAYSEESLESLLADPVRKGQGTRWGGGESGFLVPFSAATLCSHTRLLSVIDEHQISRIAEAVGASLTVSSNSGNGCNGRQLGHLDL